MTHTPPQHASKCCACAGRSKTSAPRSKASAPRCKKIKSKRLPPTYDACAMAVRSASRSRDGWLLGCLLVLYIKGARGFYPPSLAKTVLFGRDRFYTAHFNSISNINRTLTSRENFFNSFTYPAFVLKRVFFA